jgi:pimeloyl-ACP methyl ester carboxylesterase
MTDPGHQSLTVAVDDVALHVEVTCRPGPSRPPVLLVSGADSPASRWRPRLVDGLGAAGHTVIRYDHRDIGRSGKSADPYDLHRLTADAVAVLDALSITAAHVVGSSMGAMIGQLLAIDHGDRVVSLTALISSPDPASGALSTPSGRYMEAAGEMIFAPPPTDDDERVERILAGARLLTGSRYPFDEDFLRRDAATSIAQDWTLESGHMNAVLTTAPWFDRLGKLTCPALVVHGTEDPLFGTDHPEAFVEAVPHASLEIVEGLGHEVPDGLVGDLLPTLAAHLAAAESGGGDPGISSSGRPDDGS